MRITHIITRLIAGGAQENTIASVLGFQNLPKFESELITGPGGGAEGSLASRFAGRNHLLTEVPELVRPLHPWKDALALRRLIRLLSKNRPDVVHTHSGKAGILGRFAAKRAHVPIIVHTIHGPSFGDFQGVLPNTIFRTAEKWAGAITTHFVAVADAMRQQYLRAGIGTLKDYTIIHSGFDLAPYLAVARNDNLRRELGFKPGDVVVGKIGRLFKLKGHDDLFATARELIRRAPQVKFLLVGDGEWRTRFELMAEQSPFKGRFVFTGLVPAARIPELLGAMDVLAHLSRREGLARALPQALAAARPIVAYDCDGAREVCLNGETGWLIQPGDIPTLTERLVALAEDPALRQRMGLRGRELVKGTFSEQAMIEALAGLYHRLAEDCGLRERKFSS